MAPDVVSTIYGGMSAPLFIDRLHEAITVDHFLVGMIKAPVIGFFIGIIACNEGLSVHGSAASLGRHTTQSVVKSIFMVIVLDALFAIFFLRDRDVADAGAATRRPHQGPHRRLRAAQRARRPCRWT